MNGYYAESYSAESYSAESYSAESYSENEILRVLSALIRYCAGPGLVDFSTIFEELMNRVDEVDEAGMIAGSEPDEDVIEGYADDSESSQGDDEQEIERRRDADQNQAIKDWREWISLKVEERRSRKLDRPGTLTLTGLVEFIVSGHGVKSPADRVFIEWKGDQVFCWSIENRPTTFGSPDCIITVSEDVFEELKSGSINAQIAMCAGKIKVSGNSESYAELAMYTFNIFGQY